MVKALLFISTLFLVSACQPGLEVQPKVNANADVMPLPPGTVSYLSPSEKKPKLTRSLLERGEARYEIFCSVCHGYLGDGNGIAVERGFLRPPGFQALSRDTPVEYFFQIVSQGMGPMLSFSNRIPVDDRWAISYYVKALQIRVQEKTHE